MIDVCDIQVMKPMLAAHGFHFSKAKGQNFLIAPWVPQSIAEQAGVDETAGVLEIGPGIGPLASPAITSVSIFNFLTAWEEFPWALTVLNDTQKRTLPIAISGFFGQHQFTQWGYVFAMSVASLLPVLIIFICCQKYFVSGLQTGGIKG